MKLIQFALAELPKVK